MWRRAPKHEHYEPVKVALEFLVEQISYITPGKQQPRDN